MKRFSALLCIIWLGLTSLHARESLVILPEKIVLHGAISQQRLVVERLEDKEFIGDVRENVTYTSSNPGIVKIEKGFAVPVANGSATIKATVGKQTVSTKVTVTGMNQSADWTFRNHVQPVLAKFGCSSGACHGAAAGQNGFKISLRGYDDDGDYLALTRHTLGRRISPAEPAKSLLITKPTGAVPHKGGIKFDTDSLEYRVLAEWIANGTPGPKQEDPRIERIEMVPNHVVIKPGEQQQILVRAYFNDGRVEDVTRWTKYTDANSEVTNIDEHGNIKVMGFGEGAITAWYLQRIAIATVTVPHTNNLPKATFAKAPKRNFIDEQVLAKLRSLNLPPSPRATDDEFIRRAYLDTIGVLPTAQETKSFLADHSPKKRDALIETLLNRPEFIDYWSYKWSDLLLVKSEKLKPAAMWSYYHWVRDGVAKNKPWDLFAREVITARGSTLENGAANFFILHDEPKILAETTSQAFLGMSINCAQCHNHPMEKWTNNDYYGMANLFARVRAKAATGEGNQIIVDASQGELVQPLTGKPRQPRPLDGQTIDFTAENRREHLAAWLTSPENPYFTRAIVNRIWANFYGVGLVESVDDLRVTNPASNEALLSTTAKYLAEQKYDLKALMRLILQSETYQRSSEALPGNAADKRFYSRYYPRRLMAEVMLDAFSQVTGSATDFKNYPKDYRALQLPDSNIKSYFLSSFGRPDRNATCTCERTDNPSVTQVLHISNGDTVNQKLSAKGNRIEKLLMAKTPPEQIVEDAYLTALSRLPTEKERTRIMGILQKTDEKDLRPAIEDIYWALLSSREFLFNH
ncbi:MAG TPA: DUF1549 domain-containing protein [Verrucomicrobiae bacterium]